MMAYVLENTLYGEVYNYVTSSMLIPIYPPVNSIGVSVLRLKVEPCLYVQIVVVHQSPGSLVPRPPRPAFVAFILQVTKAGHGGLGTRLLASFPGPRAAGRGLGTRL